MKKKISCLRKQEIKSWTELVDAIVLKTILITGRSSSLLDSIEKHYII